VGAKTKNGIEYAIPMGMRLRGKLGRKDVMERIGYTVQL